MKNNLKEEYNLQFLNKKSIFNNFFEKFTSNTSYHPSPETNFRTRIEFSVSFIEGNFNFTMTENKNPVSIKDFHICHKKINELMQDLIKEIRSNILINEKLFQIEFQVNRQEDSFITLIYHRQLDYKWIKIASNLKAKINSSIIGRSRNQKIVLGKDFVTEIYSYSEKKFSLRLFEQCFNQPNPYICDSLINWLDQNIEKYGDIIELYCGLGTFTIFLSSQFHKIFATENSRPSIMGLKKNIKLSNASNIF